ncbi:PH domain-containing protein [Virgibacillus halophilus]|uniref:PH domain-containing protein n=1 Tax=Tigheibacillus halophilus TaxID=361280 RepID=A0ABU5C7N9_9BACI|nr:PH domain-containing protein [Virgibacillus halophilus]
MRGEKQLTACQRIPYTYNGGCSKKETSKVPITNIQNIQRKIPFYYKPFGVVFLALETNASGDHATVKLEAVGKSEAAQIERRISEPAAPQDLAERTDTPANKENMSRTVHYWPTKKDLRKASFLSFSFLALIPVLLTIFKQADEVFHVDEKAEGIWESISASYWWMALLIVVLIIAAVAFGMIKTHLTYGNYEIASDEAYIYIRKGVLNERSFSIRKSRVQAVRILQPPWKRIFQLLEVKLVIAGSDEDADDDKEINSLYPYLPSDKAMAIIQELLPQFTMPESSHRLPPKALKVRMLRLPWFWLVVTAAIFLFFKSFWYISPILFILQYAYRYFNYRNTRYSFDASMILVEQKGLWREQFMTSRKNLVEMEITQSLYQKIFGLVTVHTVNRAAPIHEETLHDVTQTVAKALMDWYEKRGEDIRLKA